LRLHSAELKISLSKRDIEKVLEAYCLENNFKIVDMNNKPVISGKDPRTPINHDDIIVHLLNKEVKEVTLLQIMRSEQTKEIKKWLESRGIKYYKEDNLIDIATNCKEITNIFWDTEWEDKPYKILRKNPRLIKDAPKSQRFRGVTNGCIRINIKGLI
jgi:hypothetical protein